MALADQVKTKLEELVGDTATVHTEAEEINDSGANVVEVFNPETVAATGYGGDVVEYLTTIAVQVRCATYRDRNSLLFKVDQLETRADCLPEMASSVELISSTTGYDDTPGEQLPHGGISTFNYRTGTDPREE